MKFLSKAVTKIPWVIIVVIILITGFLGYKIKDLKIEANVETAIPDSIPEVKYFNEVNEIFPKQEFFIVGLVTDTLFTAKTIEKLDALTYEFEGVEGVKQVISPTNVKLINGTADGIIEVAPILEYLPETDEEIEAYRREITTNRLYKDTFISKDETAAITLIQIESDVSKDAILKEIRSIINENKEAGEQYRIAGEAATLTEVKDIITNDIMFLSPIVVVVILLALFISFRNIRGVVLPIMTVIISVIWTIGIMSIVNVPLSIMAAVMPTILIAIGSAYGIHIINRFIIDVRNGKDKKEAIKETIKHTGAAVLMAGLTTMAGFLSFLSSQIQIIKEFGIFTAVGVICALIFSMTFIPALLYMLPIPKRISLSFKKKKSAQKKPAKVFSFTGGLVKLGNFVYSHKIIVFIVVVCLFIVSIFGILNLRVESDLVQMFGKNTQIMQDNEFFNKYFSGTMTLQVVIDSENPDFVKEPDVLKKIEAFQEYAADFSIVGSSQSLADMIKEMNRVMNEDKESFFVIPDSRELISQYLILYSMTEEESTLENLVTYDFSKANVILFVKSINLTQLRNFEETINNYIRQNMQFEDAAVHITGRISTLSVLSELIVESQLLSIIISLILVFIITAVIFRSPILGFISVIPIIITICLNFGLMGLFNIPLDLATVMIASIAIGIGIDYSIHYISHYKTERMKGISVPDAIKNTNTMAGKAIVFNAISVGAGFLVLLLSSLASIGVLGGMIALTMFFSSLGSMTVIPAIFSFMEKKKLLRKAVLKKAADSLLD